MSTNRLYLVDSETGDNLLIAKSMGAWRPVIGPDALEEPGLAMDALGDWLNGHDLLGATGSKTQMTLVDESGLADLENRSGK